MKRWARWTLGTAGVLAALAATAVGVGLLVAEARINRTVPVSVQAVALPTDTATLERGRYLYASRGCTDCHGANGAGRTFLDNGMLKVAGPHIAPGPGSVTATYRAEDWVRTVRHGVKPDGRPALIMPSEDYNRLTDADLGAIAAYVRSMPPVNGSAALIELGLPVRLMVAAGIVRDAAAKIDHTLPPEQPVPDGPTPEHGRYIANMCIGCHGPQLTGGKIPSGPPDWPAAANLTPGDGSGMARYTDAAALARMFQSGRRPDGSTIAVMPFEALREMNETDVQALHAYLQTLAPRPAGAH